MLAPLRAALFLALAASTSTGCALDEIGGSDDRDQVLGIECNATFKTTGTFVLGAPQPADVDGCWPVGTWTFSATVDTNECGTPPALLPQYQFKVERLSDSLGDPVDAYTFLTEPSAHHRLKVSSGGGGLCEGGLEIFSEDGKQYWNFKPALEADLSIDGFGEYALYTTDQWN